MFKSSVAIGTIAASPGFSGGSCADRSAILPSTDCTISSVGLFGTSINTGTTYTAVGLLLAAELMKEKMKFLSHGPHSCQVGVVASVACLT